MRLFFIFSFYFFSPFIFSQTVPETEQDTSMPYYVFCKIPGFEDEQVLSEKFSGASEVDQIVIQLLYFINHPSIYKVYVCNSKLDRKSPRVLFERDFVFLEKNSKTLGFEEVQEGEGFWQPLSRILNRLKEKQPTTLSKTKIFPTE